MPSAHEAVLLALEAELASHTAVEMREQELPQTIPPEGLINIAPGDPVEDAFELGTGRRSYSREIELEHVVQGASKADRASLLDAILTETAGLLHLSVLGGAIDYLQVTAPQDADDIPIQGAASMKGAVLPIIVFYQTSHNPMETLP